MSQRIDRARYGFVFVFAVALYCGSYFCLVQRKSSGYAAVRGGTATWYAEVEYRACNDGCQRVFLPLHWIDKSFVRPRYWDDLTVRMSADGMKEWEEWSK
ncbi:MAG: hypothetical protein HOL01_19470 [Planctomycetaceae bacterium]|mgnify:CR=1|jgi:hypothetical protein|nr:hypothetical protein [Planctomycetaceae bacterium]MBT6484826.1 hypothetical protein [Planctomycetaceae bacterium]MBT6496720.1 hypothetical protein [Planctomycetaceae bacterium]